ncbi:MAG: hypothetical protein K6T83_05440 [Alicyclobacillus sp.]|nr:hypothetical protein [Alicyclobacillus sp.]
MHGRLGDALLRWLKVGQALDAVQFIGGVRPMDPDYVQLILEAERSALASLNADHTSTTFTCPICGGEAHITLHEWLGHVSNCTNGCF